MDTDPFSDHNKPTKFTSEWPDPDETIPINQRGMIKGGSTGEVMSETSVSGKTQSTRLLESHIDSLYKELSGCLNQTSTMTYYECFKCKGREPYFKGKNEPLSYRGRKLKSAKTIEKLLGFRRLSDLGLAPQMLMHEEAMKLNVTE